MLDDFVHADVVNVGTGGVCHERDAAFVARTRALAVVAEVAGASIDALLCDHAAKRLLERHFHLGADFCSQCKHWKLHTITLLLLFDLLMQAAIHASRRMLTFYFTVACSALK